AGFSAGRGLSLARDSLPVFSSYYIFLHLKLIAPFLKFVSIRANPVCDLQTKLAPEECIHQGRKG
ncbi:MAG: hypothetical protein KKH17_05610, partial [Proteobacteria bacterium]|nr:hypothetical protein [Pseudomonadota bacterium]